MTLTDLTGHLGGRRGPLLVLCLPVLLAIAASLVGPRPQSMANIPVIEGLSFDQYLVDLREVAPTEEIFGTFFFKNTCPHEVTITKLEPSCGCMQPQMSQKVYQPGETGRFLLRIKTALQHPGRKEFNVKVHYTDPQPRTREVHLRAVFPEAQIYVKPMSLTFHQIGTSPVDQEIIVTDLRKTPADIIGVQSTSDLVQLEILEPLTTKTGARQQRVRVTIPGAVPTGRHQATVKIFTNDDKFHELKVPIQVFGQDKQSLVPRMAGPLPMGPVRR